MHSYGLEHVARSVVIFVSIPKSNFRLVFDVFLDLVILPYLHAISIEFYEIKCLIYIYSVKCQCLLVDKCLYTTQKS